ncbi:nitronate monooxygenase [Solirubrobacter ginsenosidimutans]|uniref:Nitronate monooxygenase n=1 Tax=Solirubrobacter ginsenosidimutans TaxID=490573 RepID=A0A9X3S9P2_9ACTN|nr:nitronate monooxygenase [Solirubrobacter ginsenosidimutans]MDA0165223.1 nitronate monooxygenase [Solirubrobacter ginsenosidimutans]
MTAFTELLGCRFPIQQAPMGGVSSAPQLPVAVAAAGGFGMLSAVLQPAEVLAATLAVLPSRAAIGVNFLVPFLEDRAAVEVAAARVPLVDFFWGEPDAALISLVHDGGALASWQVGSVEEARAAAEAGCDLVVVQGVEAGGHVRGRLGLLALLDLVLEAVDVPVIAAGGLATERSVAAVLAAGAAAARVGTRFVATHEARAEGAHPDYVDALLRSRGEDTVLTEAYSAMWPAAPHRVLASCIEAASAGDSAMVGETSMGGATFGVPRWAVVSPNASTTGEIAAMALYAGQGVGAVNWIGSAADVVHELAGQKVQI